MQELSGIPPVFDRLIVMVPFLFSVNFTSTIYDHRITD